MARNALEEEAKTIYESVRMLHAKSPESIQIFLDRVCARMSDKESPGHHIVFIGREQTIQARAHHRDRPEMPRLMARWAARRDTHVPYLVGSFHGALGTIYVAETATNVRRAATKDLMREIAGFVAMGILAAGLAQVMLMWLVNRPIVRLSRALESVAGGQLDNVVSPSTSRELQLLVDSFNSMSRQLAQRERQRAVQMEHARSIQQHLLPPDSCFGPVVLHSYFRPAEDVAGDYYDAIKLPDQRVLFCVADVAGHGVGSAMAACIIKTLLLEAVGQCQTAGQILQFINARYTHVIGTGNFATMGLGILSARERSLQYAAGGHEPPWIITPDNEVLELVHTDLVIGVDAQMPYRDTTVPVDPGTRVLIVSDGVTEAMNPEERLFGREGVEKVLQQCRAEPTETLVARLVEAMENHRQHMPASDDVTIVVVELNHDSGQR